MATSSTSASMSKVVLGFSFILFVSCSSLTKEECRDMNWQSRGVHDGSRGESADKFSSYEQSCKEHQITISRAAWTRGHAAGLRKFCTHKKGYELGLKGEDYPEACGKHQDSLFYVGYQKGFDDYRFTKISAENQAQGMNQCHSDVDCGPQNTCSFNQCSLSGQNCHSDYECGVQLRCQKESTIINGHSASYNVCR